MSHLQNSGTRHYHQSLLILAYLFILSAPLIFIKLMFSATGRHDMLSEIGNDSVLIAFPLLALQPVLAARLTQMDRLFGLDMLYAFHKTMGMTAATLLFCAPIFLAFSENQTRTDAVSITGAALALILVTTALLYEELHMRYEQWRKLHNVLALIVFTLPQ